MAKRPTELIVTLPHPRIGCRPNSRQHWAAKARCVAADRRDAGIAALDAISRSPLLLLPFRSPVVRIRWLVRDRRGLRADSDNQLAACKAFFDGLTDAGVWWDDRAVRFLPVETAIDPDPRLELRIMEAGTDDAG